MIPMRKAIITLLLLPALLLPLSACGGGMSDQTAMTYIQGTLDQNYLGKADDDFMSIVDTDAEEVAETYEGSLETEALLFLGSFVESTLDQETTDRLTAELVEMYREIYAHSKYTVDSASQMDENTYSVKVTVEPINIFHQVADAMAGGAVDELNDQVADAMAGGAVDELNAKYPDEFESEEQYAQYEVEWVELFIDLTYEKLPGLGYLEPASTLVQVTWDETDELWDIPDEDFWSLDALIIDYNF